MTKYKYIEITVYCLLVFPYNYAFIHSQMYHPSCANDADCHRKQQGEVSVCLKSAADCNLQPKLSGPVCPSV